MRSTLQNLQTTLFVSRPHEPAFLQCRMQMASLCVGPMASKHIIGAAQLGTGSRATRAAPPALFCLCRVRQAALPMASLACAASSDGGSISMCAATYYSPLKDPPYRQQYVSAQNLPLPLYSISRSAAVLGKKLFVRFEAGRRFLCLQPTNRKGGSFGASRH